MKNSRNGSGAAEYRVDYRPTAVKDLDGIPIRVQDKIFAAVDALGHNPLPRGTKKIKDARNRFRIRVGDYRIVYRIHFDERLVQVEFVRHRKDIYKQLD
jgi:mRNA interferase RelE/StbE